MRGAGHATLRCLLEGDWSQRQIVVYTLDAGFDVGQWSRQVATALLPSAVQVFSRNRWLTNLRPLSAAALLGACHHLLSRVVPSWLQLLRGKEVARWQDTGVPARRLRWDVVDSDASGDEGGGQRDEEVAEEAARAAPMADWAAFQERQRGNAAAFASRNPGQALLLARYTLSPVVRLFDRMLDMASVKWETRQHFECISSGTPLHTRLAEAHAGSLTSDLFGMCACF